MSARDGELGAVRIGMRNFQLYESWCMMPGHRGSLNIPDSGVYFG